MGAPVADLLPPNATSLERNLARAGALIERVPVPLRDLANPAACPASALPFLAASFSVDHWDTTWPVSTKRAMIQSAFAVHKQKGTISALRHALRPISAGIRVREWWQTTPPGPRGTFQLEFDMLDTGVTSAMYQEIERLVDEAKPVTRHMTGLAITMGVRGAAQVGAVVHQGDELTIYARTPIEVRATGLCCTSAVVHQGDELTVYARTPIEIRVRGAAQVSAGVHQCDALTIFPAQAGPAPA